MYYLCQMNIFNWSIEKNEWLKINRGIGFEDIIFSISEGNLIEVVENPSKNFPNQTIFIIQFMDYIYLVPFIRNENEIFLKTIIPSRKATKKYLGGKKR